MGATSDRTVENTLRFAMQRDLLHRQSAGGYRHKAEYRATLPTGLADPRTEPIMRIDPRTGERLPNGRRPRSLPTSNPAKVQLTASGADATAHLQGGQWTNEEPMVTVHLETGSLPTSEGGPLVVEGERNPPPSPAPDRSGQTDPGPDRNGGGDEERVPARLSSLPLDPHGSAAAAPNPAADVLASKGEYLSPLGRALAMAREAGPLPPAYEPWREPPGWRCGLCQHLLPIHYRRVRELCDRCVEVA
jgi:hypothetical protein